MPQTGKLGGLPLRIDLIDPPFHYCAGDVIIGTVSRKAHVVSPRGWVTINLLGRAKTKLERRSGKHTHTFRGRFHFFDMNQMKQKIHDGPLHVPPGGEPVSWPFSITIPTHANPRSVRSGNGPDNSYLSIEPNDIANHQLPSTFAASYYGFGPDFEGYVEYYLEAELRLEGHSHVDKATYPIFFRAPSTLTPISNFERRSAVANATVSSLHMVPGMEAAELSFKQKAQTFFGSTKIPNFSFTSEFSSPTMIQLGHPLPVPFLLRVKPRPDQTSDIIRDVLQTVYLESMRMEIKSRTDVMTPSHGFSSNHTTTHVEDTDLAFASFFNRLKARGPIVVPQGADADFLNIGEHLELQIFADKVKVLGQVVTKFLGVKKLYPNFKTYNIKHSHFIEWEVILKIADQTYKVFRQHPLVIVAPSEEQEAARLAAIGKPPAMTTQEDVPRYDAVVGETEELPSYQEAAAESSSSRVQNAAGGSSSRDRGASSGGEQPQKDTGAKRQPNELQGDENSEGDE